jgi:hypothetical protein
MPGGPRAEEWPPSYAGRAPPRLPRPIRRWSSMRTSWMLSRRMVSATRNRRGEPGTSGRRTTTAGLLAGLVLSLVLALSGCGAGGGSDSATRPSTERSGTRPDPSGTESPSETTTEPTRPTRTPTSAERPNSPTTTPATSAEALAPTAAPTPSAAGAPAAAAESEGLGALGWTLLIVLVVALVAGWLLWRSRRRSAWDAQAAALEQDARTATGIQLPPVLTAESAGSGPCRGHHCGPIWSTSMPVPPPALATRASAAIAARTDGRPRPTPDEQHVNLWRLLPTSVGRGVRIQGGQPGQLGLG